MNSSLHDETTFYKLFINDLQKVKREVIIESPFITTERMKLFRPIFKKLIDKGLKIYIVTRHPHEHTGDYKIQSETAISFFEQIGVQSFLCTGNHHDNNISFFTIQFWLEHYTSFHVFLHIDKTYKKTHKRFYGLDDSNHTYPFSEVSTYRK